ncbi:MAG: hypothetical protein Q7S40_20855 [Opitutaceae bacterium]|nr:hypothetical protein [Opitutaceae bacterium]
MLAIRRPRLWPQLVRLIALAYAAIPAGIQAQDWAPNLTLTSTWHDNATNAKPAADQISALQFEADMVASKRFSVGRDDSLHPTAHFAGEWWPRFNGLNRAAAGARLEWRHKFGLGALAPVFSIEGGANVVAARESERRGTSTVLLATIRKRINHALRFALTQEFSDYNARAAVFDRQGAETAVEVGRDVTTSSRVTLRFSYRDGDVLSHATPPRPDLVALAPNRVSIGTFGRELTAYSIEARTFGARLGVVHAVDTDTALMAVYEVRQTRREPLRYLNQLVSVAIVHQF